MGTSISKLEVLENCFSTSTQLMLQPENEQMTLTFDPTNNAVCSKIPKGIELQIKLDVLPTFVPTGYFVNFAYGSTNTFIISCKHAECQSSQFWTAKKAKVTLNTFQFTTQTSIGSIQRQQQNYIGCFASNESSPFYSRWEVQSGTFSYAMAINQECANRILQASGPTFVGTNIQKAEATLYLLDKTATVFKYDQALGLGSLAVTQQAEGYWVHFTFAAANAFGIIADGGFHYATISVTFMQNVLQTVYDQTINQYAFVFSSSFVPLQLQYFQTRFLAIGKLNPQPPFNTYQSKLVADGITKTVSVLYIVFQNGTIGNFVSEDQFSFSSSIEMNFRCENQVNNTFCVEIARLMNELPISNYSAKLRVAFYAGDTLKYIASQKFSIVIDSCFEPSKLYYSTSKLRFELVKNPLSTKCQMVQTKSITTNIEISNTTTFQNILSFNIQMNQSTSKIEIQNTLTDNDQMKNTRYMRLYFYENGIQLDQMTIQKKLNANTDQVTTQFLIILGACIAASVVWSVSYMLLTQYVKHRRLQNSKIVKIKTFDNEESGK